MEDQMGQSIQEWTKWNLRKTTFKKFEVIWSDLSRPQNFIRPILEYFVPDMLARKMLYGGLSLMMLWNSEKQSNFKAHELSWTVNELCTRILRVSSSCPPLTHIHRWTLWKNHPSAVFSSKMQHKRHNTHTHRRTSDKKTEIRNIKL